MSTPRDGAERAEGDGTKQIEFSFPWSSILQIAFNFDFSFRSTACGRKEEFERDLENG